MQRSYLLWVAAFFTHYSRILNVSKKSGELIRMRPGVPWNVKGIEEDAREAAQAEARRAGVSVGEWLSGLIRTNGKEGRPGGYSQSQQAFHQAGHQPGDGTFGPQNQPYYPPLVQAPKYPQAVPPGNSQAYPQTYPYASQIARQPQPYQPLHPHQGQHQHMARDPGLNFEQHSRGDEYAAFAGGARELAERFDQSERRAQMAIAAVNQTVVAMQDRMDAAERVKQLAEAAFTSAAEALTQSAREQARAFDSMEHTVRSVQKRIIEIESGQAEWPGRESILRLESALGQLQKRLGDLDADRADLPAKDTITKLEATLGQLQKRLADMEAASTDAPGKDALVRLETSITSMRGEVADADRRTREDITQMAKFMRDLGARVDSVERGSTLAESVSARFDALEARSASMFDEIRGQMSAVDGRIAQATSAKSTISPGAFAALKGSVEGIASRLDGMSEQSPAPLASSIGAIESTLSVITAKIEQSDKRSAESVTGVNSALRALSSRIEDSDKRHTQSLNALARRLDESDHRAGENARDIHKSLDEYSGRLEASEKRHKDAISGLRLTVDGFIANGIAEGLPVDPRLGRATARPSALSSLQSYSPPPVAPPPMLEPEIPPFLTMGVRALSGDAAPPPPPFDDGRNESASGHEYSLSALQTMLAGPLSSQDADHDPSRFEGDRFHVAGGNSVLGDYDQDQLNAPPKTGGDYMAKARHAAKAAAELGAERSRNKRQQDFGQDQSGGRNLGRLMIIALAGVAVVAGIVAVLFTLPSGPGDDGVERPVPGATIGDLLNGQSEPAVPPSSGGAGTDAQPAGADFAPLPPADETAAANGAPTSVTAAPNGLGVPSQVSPAEPEFTAGASPLPGSASDTAVTSLESGAVRGDAKAQFLLSLRYSEGRDVVKDDGRAASLATKAAEQGLAIAQYRLGALYERGVGVPKSLAQAKAWYEKAAKSGNRKAMHNLAVLLADTNSGQPNYKEAARWFREGATYGLTDSQYNLAVLLEQGMGVPKNVKEAATWFAVASAQGDTGAAERLDALKKLLSPGDIAMALDAARKYRAKGLDPSSNELPSGPG